MVAPLGAGWYPDIMKLAVLMLSLSVVAPVSAAVVPLNVSDIIGTWVGKCTQVETGVETGILGTFQKQSDTLIMGSWKTAGPFFGCPAADPGGYPLFKNGKRNGWTDHALHVRGKDNLEPFGRVNIRTKGTTFIVKGKKACNGLGPKSYKGTGLLEGRTFTLTLKGKIQGEVATFTCSWFRPI